MGVTCTDADLDRHHDAFRSELPQLLGRRGRLVVARLGDGDPVGVGALKPIDDATAEVKRMYVRLVADARAERFAVARLETLRFMTTAQATYRAFGFVEVAPFDGSEAARSGLDPFTIFRPGCG